MIGGPSPRNATRTEQALSTVDYQQREQMMLDWLAAVTGGDFTAPAPASGDASFRRYFRIMTAGGSAIVMDAPPGLEDCRPFVDIAGMLRDWGLNAPLVMQQDLDQGFLLLSDLGSSTYLDVMSEQRAVELYPDALEALVVMQRNALTDSRAQALPAYDTALLQREMALFPEWFLERHLDLRFSDDDQRYWESTCETLVKSALAQPPTFVHRDYHSRNLMYCTTEQGGNPGILDFQDAQYGPLTYDLVSLLRDCYVDWPPARIRQWLEEYMSLAGDSVLRGLKGEALWQAFDLMGVQRHLKAIGIFARLKHRDGKSGYLADIPRTLGYVAAVAATRSSLTWLGEFIEHRVWPAWAERHSR